MNSERELPWARRTVVLGAVLAGLAVATGAFGAHALRGSLEPARLEIYETAARYQMYHALAIILAGVIGSSDKLQRVTTWLFLSGIVLFSGSLYALALSGRTWLGAITPLGGLAFLAGWACFALGGLRPQR